MPLVPLDYATTAKVLIERVLKLNENEFNFKSQYGSLLQLAAALNLTDVLQLLLDKGLYDTVDRVSSSGETPLTAAARTGKYDQYSHFSLRKRS